MSFKICGIKVEFTFFFVAIIAFIVTLQAPENVIFAIASSLLHEAGHLIAMLLIGNKPEKVSFHLVGMNIIREKNMSISVKKEILIALGGPLANFILVILSCGLLCIYNSAEIMTFACVNFALMTFNLLPVKRLDGGMILFYFLMIFFDAQTSVKTLNIISWIFLTFVYLWGIYILTITRYNFSLIIIAVFLTISMLGNNDY